MYASLTLDDTAACNPLIMKRNSFTVACQRSLSHDLGMQSRQDHQGTIIDSDRKVRTASTADEPGFKATKTRITANSADGH